MQNNRETHEFQQEERIQIVEETSMPNWSQALEKNESVMDSTHSNRGTREENSTQCTEERLEKQTTYRSPKGTEKQIYCMLLKRRHLRYSQDAEANDKIHRGSDHRCVTATFVINALKKNGSREANNNKQRMTTMGNISAQTVKKDTKKHSRSKTDIKNSKKRSNRKLQPQKSDLKQNDDEKTSGTTEV